MQLERTALPHHHHEQVILRIKLRLDRPFRLGYSKGRRRRGVQEVKEDHRHYATKDARLLCQTTGYLHREVDLQQQRIEGRRHVVLLQQKASYVIEGHHRYADRLQDGL